MSQKIISTYRSAGSATAPKYRRSIGNCYEQLAAEHLEKQGLQLIRSNYHCRLGEIDLIMQDQNTLVFVEVRYRLRNDFVSAVVSINPTKQQKILRTAMVYLKQHKLNDKVPCRIDLIGLTRCRSTGELIVEWIKNAIMSNV
jgi:putative endonuclease